MTKEEIQYLLHKYHLRPRKEQGQHFLLDESVITAMLNAAHLTGDDVILEIGPGFGILTRAFVERARRVVIVEQDRDIFPFLQQLATIHSNLQPFCADIRRVNRVELGLRDMQYCLVANLPYSIASWVIREFCEVAPRPSRMVIMIQKEVATRLTAMPGAMSILGVITQMFAEVKSICEVPRSSFYPMPDVTSAVVALTLRAKPQSADPTAFIRLVKSGFAAKRKQLQNNLRTGLGCSAKEIIALCTRANIDPTVRAEDLAVTDWERLRLAI